MTTVQSPEALERSVRHYRRLLVLYPREFRDEYGDDLVQGFRDLMIFSRDHSWWRTTRDLVTSATGERFAQIASGNRPPPRTILLIALAIAVGIVVGAPTSPEALLAPLFLVPPLVLAGLPIFGVAKLREAFVVRRATGSPVGRTVALGLASFVPAAVFLAVFGGEAGYWIFVSISLTLIVGSGLGIVWAMSTLLSKSGAPAGRWRRPALVLIPSVAILAFIIGASVNSWRNSLGPPGDHSVANASTDTRALWDAADTGDVDEVLRLTTTTCADPWVKFPHGNGRHNAKGQAETRGIEVPDDQEAPFDEIADHLGRYQSQWSDRCDAEAD